MEKSLNFEKIGTPREKTKKTAENEIKNYYEEKVDFVKEKVVDELETKEIHNESYRAENIPADLLSTANFYEENGIKSIEQIHAWYEQAMGRRDREGLEFGRFLYHFFEGGSFDDTYMFGDKERGYLLGYTKYEVFIPTHFAPKSIRKGYELLKELGGSDKIPALMTITPDLVKTISKMPEWQVVDMNFLATFRDEVVDKKIVHNSNPKIQQLLWGMLKEYFDERNENLSFDDED